MEVATTVKPWYRINKDVEYSTDFDFFLENQLLHVQECTTHTFSSRLNGNCFKIHRDTFDLMNEPMLKMICRTIHEEILAGKHGAGKFVD